MIREQAISQIQRPFCPCKISVQRDEEEVKDLSLAETGA